MLSWSHLRRHLVACLERRELGMTAVMRQALALLDLLREAPQLALRRCRMVWRGVRRSCI